MPMSCSIDPKEAVHDWQRWQELPQSKPCISGYALTNEKMKAHRAEGRTVQVRHEMTHYSSHAPITPIGKVIPLQEKLLIGGNQ